VDDALYIHGSRGSRLLTRLADGAPACVTMTIIDGLVLARCAFHHSMNYRSVVVLGCGAEVMDRAEKARVFDALVEHVIPGRLHDVRRPTESEIDATMLVRIPMMEASAKIRTGPPKDDERDMNWPHWAGVIPLSVAAGEPIAAPDLDLRINIPEYARHYVRMPPDHGPQ
jgi:nitroimidazol reductase NimA-like FMN-containing flavoprotein (pyridoxamine 5'-phosphate oxidase superfamily)